MGQDLSWGYKKAFLNGRFPKEAHIVEEDKRLKLLDILSSMNLTSICT